MPESQVPSSQVFMCLCPSYSTSSCVLHKLLEDLATSSCFILTISTAPFNNPVMPNQTNPNQTMLSWLSLPLNAPFPLPGLHLVQNSTQSRLSEAFSTLHCRPSSLPCAILKHLVYTCVQACTTPRWCYVLAALAERQRVRSLRMNRFHILFTFALFCIC